MRNARLISTLLAILTFSDITAQMVIGGSTPAATAVLDLQSTAKGFLPPRLTSLQRNAIASPAQGLTIFNTNLKIVETYNGTRWVNVATGIATGCGAKTSATDWKDFLCHNLGADQGADPFTPSYRLNGHYYQWGYAPPCFGINDAAQPCPSPYFGAHGPWGSGSSAGNDQGYVGSWNTTTAPNGSWADAGKTTKDPCPPGYRVPTKTEWEAVVANNAVSTVGAWNTIPNPTNYNAGVQLGTLLYLPGTGYREESIGILDERGDAGYYWSSTESSTDAWGLKIDSGTPAMAAYPRTRALSVRCIRE